MTPSDFLFPRDLEVTPAELRSILMIGSCLLSDLAGFAARDAGLAADHILFNNASDLPSRTPDEIARYDCQ